MLWDLGGDSHARRPFYKGARGILFVVDSSDRSRFAAAREALEGLMQEPDLSGAKLLVHANKQVLQRCADVLRGTILFDTVHSVPMCCLLMFSSVCVVMQMFAVGCPWVCGCTHHRHSLEASGAAEEVVVYPGRECALWLWAVRWYGLASSCHCKAPCCR